MQTWTFPERRPPGDGPWSTEPDKAQWVDEATDLDCLAVRNRSGAWCGYVGVPKGHWGYGKDYGAVDAYVHGGLTFADRCQPQEEDRGICHVPEPGRTDDVWWLGFDCAHAGDLVPGLGFDFPGDVYRDLAYVKAECADLARQLAAAVR